MFPKLCFGGGPGGNAPWPSTSQHERHARAVGRRPLEAAAILRGEAAPARVWNPPACIDVRAIRRGLGLSQPAFAHHFGFSVSAVREWEQGRRQPEAAARVLLLVIARRPEVVDEVLAAAAPQAA